VGGMVCRACRGRSGEVVLDLGEQPACDYFPARDDPGPDPVYPLEMWLCSTCGLAQLVTDPTVPEEPRGAEPAALTAQAAAAVEELAASGWLREGLRVTEYGSPHGGSWLHMLTQRGMTVVEEGERADVVLDCFGMMHCANQAGGLAERAERVAANGVLLLQYHSLAAILRHGQWNALRHGHYAYYSTPSLIRLLAGAGFSPRTAWRFDLYGGTILLAAMRDVYSRPPDASVSRLIVEEDNLRVGDPLRIADLQRIAESGTNTLRDWLARQRSAGVTVLGYGAASRTVALLCRAGVDSSLLPAVADASPAKQGCRMPGTDIPVISSADLIDARPHAVVLFLSDLLAEVRVRLPEVEARGGRWVDISALPMDNAS
jgi:hypothetical protein